MIISLCILLLHCQYALWNVSYHTNGAFDLEERLCKIPYKKKGWDLFRRKCDENSRFTLISIHKDEPEASIVKERDSEEYKENGRWIIIEDE